MLTKSVFIAVLCLGILDVRVSHAASGSPVTVTIPGAVVDKAKHPAPPANAGKKKGIGNRALAVGTANTPDDDDSYWIEQIDVDGDGSVEETNLLWDDEDKVLYLYADGDFRCANGKPASGGMLIAIFADGNPAKKPAGSGWYAVELDAGECAVKAAGVYGCRFDAKQQPTACGVATLDEKHDELTVVTAAAD